MNAEAEEAPESVVPIRPGARIEHERSKALLEHVAEHLADFPLSHDGEQPASIVFMLIGTEGTTRVQWLAADMWRSNLALAGALISHRAATEPDD